MTLLAILFALACNAALVHGLIIFGRGTLVGHELPVRQPDLHPAVPSARDALRDPHARRHGRWLAQPSR